MFYDRFNITLFTFEKKKKEAIIVIIIITPNEFFTPAFADGLSLEDEWQQVSLSLQDSSYYSSRS